MLREGVKRERRTVCSLKEIQLREVQVLMMAVVGMVVMTAERMAVAIWKG